MTSWAPRGRSVLAATLTGLVLALAACTRQPVPSPSPHYVLGAPYQVRGVWWYPDESYDLNETGLASVIEGDAHRLTTDGEVFDQSALAAAHPTIQLPAVARLTNLENGLEVSVRINDRGSGNPTRLVEMTRRTAELLRVPAHGVARVRLRVLPAESRAAADAVPGAPSLKLAAAPRGSVEVAALAPPPGIRQGSAHDNGPYNGPRATPQQASADIPVVAPSRLPEIVTQTVPAPGVLMLWLDTFDEFHFANIQRAKMSSFGARIVPVIQGRMRRFRVEVGPLPDIARADAALMQALASGIPDARIVVD